MASRLWWLLLVLYSFEIPIQGRYVYFSTKLTWMNAWRKCHSCYDGQLTVLPKNINSTLTKYLSKEFWTGKYTEHSTWMSIDGCAEKVHFKKTITLTNASVQACQKYCTSENSTTFAISNHICSCDINNNGLRKTTDTRCSIKCDDKAYCGGQDVFTLYESVHVLTNNNPDELCSRFVCNKTSVEYYDVGCDNNTPVLCANKNEMKELNWSKGMSECLSKEAKYLMSVKKHSQCEKIKGKKLYWNGIFRPKRSRNDTMYTSKTKNWDLPKPVFLFTIEMHDGEKKERSYKPEDKKTFQAFCKTADVREDIVDGTTFCPTTVMSSTVSTLLTSKVSTLTSVDMNSVTNSLPQDGVSNVTTQPLPQKNNVSTENSKSAAIIGGTMAGISIIIIFLVLIVIFLWRTRKRKELKEHETDQSLHLSNQGYEAHTSDIPTSSQLYNNLDDHEYIEVKPPTAVFSVAADQCNDGKYEECIPKHEFQKTEVLPRNSHVYQTLQNHEYIDITQSNDAGYFDIQATNCHRNNGSTNQKPIVKPTSSPVQGSPQYQTVDDIARAQQSSLDAEYFVLQTQESSDDSQQQSQQEPNNSKVVVKTLDVHDRGQTEGDTLDTEYFALQTQGVKDTFNIPCDATYFVLEEQDKTDDDKIKPEGKMYKYDNDRRQVVNHKSEQKIDGGEQMYMSNEDEYDYLNQSNLRKNVTIDTDDTYSHAKSPSLETSLSDKMKGTENGNANTSTGPEGDYDVLNHC